LTILTAKAESAGREVMAVDPRNTSRRCPACGGHLLVLAGEGVPDGAHLHLEDSNGLEDGSVGLVLERSDEE
ncbi:zinc ribbon domain-containing protein, partial [Streptomyces sp. NPDC002785]|uniref:Imm32 family immunity protein n=1 Tax=Streptomyces sp. NPDC002785 TaxID=3154543 RepID=UPI003327BA24